MKKLIFLLLLLIPLMGSAQFKDLFKPVTPQTFSATDAQYLTGTDKSIEWLVRLQLNLTGSQWNYDKAMQKIISKQLVSAGAGLGLQHFKDIDTNPFPDYGAYLLLLYGQEQPITPLKETSFSVAVVFNGFGILNVGPVYDLGSKKLGLLTGVSIHF